MDFNLYTGIETEVPLRSPEKGGEELFFGSWVYKNEHLGIMILVDFVRSLQVTEILIRT